MVKPAARKQLALQAKAERNLSIRLVCQTFAISETCYRYQPKLAETNQLIADWLIRLTTEQTDWVSGLCFDYLRNVKRYA